MKDQSFMDLVNAYRTAKRAAEPYQEETSRKYSKIPSGVLDTLFEAIEVVLHEELNV